MLRFARNADLTATQIWGQRRFDSNADLTATQIWQQPGNLVTRQPGSLATKQPGDQQQKPTDTKEETVTKTNGHQHQKPKETKEEPANIFNNKNNNNKILRFASNADLTATLIWHQRRFNSNADLTATWQPGHPATRHNHNNKIYRWFVWVLRVPRASRGTPRAPPRAPEDSLEGSS